MSKGKKSSIRMTEYPFPFGSVQVTTDIDKYPDAQSTLDQAMFTGQPPPEGLRGELWIRFWRSGSTRPIKKIARSPLEAFKFLRNLDGMEIISSEISNGKLYLLINGVTVRSWDWPSADVDSEDRSMVAELARIAGATEEELKGFLDQEV